MLSHMTFLRRCVKRTLAGTLALPVMFALSAAGPAVAGELVIDAAANAKRFKVAILDFTRAYPDIKVSTLAVSTGTMVKRAITEKENPRADVIRFGPAWAHIAAHDAGRT